MKRCSRCKKELPLSSFQLRDKHKNTYVSSCKLCLKNSRVKYKNRDKIFVENKICNKCKENKDRYCFYIHDEAKDGLRASCKECYSKASKEYNCRNVKKNFYCQIKRKYNLEEEKYLSMLNKQDGKCFLCGGNERICIDHNHNTGKIRKLLCSSCNSAIGLFKENIEVIRNAALYLEEFHE